MSQVSLGPLALFLASSLAIVIVLNKKNGKEKEDSEEMIGPPISESISSAINDAEAAPTNPLASPYRRRGTYKEFSAPTPKPNPMNRESKANALFMLSPGTSSAKLVAPIVKRISSSSETGDVIVIGIAGGSGSGKTTLARAIYESIGQESISLISHDSYYKDLSHLTMEQRELQNFDHPDSLDTALLVQHVKALRNHETILIPQYSFQTHTRTKETTVLNSKHLILVEGILIFSDPSLYNLLDIRIFVDTDDDIRLIRRLQRDTLERGRSLSSVIHQYLQTVRPMHLQYVEPSKRNADIIVPVGLNSVALDLVETSFFELNNEHNLSKI